MDDVIAFAELGEAIDSPMETYSSGMVVRLAFAIAIHSDPDALIVDETLSVGDFSFKQKCLERVKSLREQLAMVLVSHSMNDISRFCDRVIVLDDGKIVFHGPAEPAIEIYKKLASEGLVAAHSKPLIPQQVDRRDWLEGVSITFDPGPQGSDEIQVVEGEALTCGIAFHVRKATANLIVGVTIYTTAGEIITGLSTDNASILGRCPAGAQIDLKLKIPNITLNPGRYRMAVGVVDGLEFLFLDTLPDLIVTPSGRLSWGSITLEHSWTLATDEDGTATP